MKFQSDARGSTATQEIRVRARPGGRLSAANPAHGRGAPHCPLDIDPSNQAPPVAAPPAPVIPRAERDGDKTLNNRARNFWPGADRVPGFRLGSATARSTTAPRDGVLPPRHAERGASQTAPHPGHDRRPEYRPADAQGTTESPRRASLRWNGKSNTLVLRAGAHLDLTMIEQVQQTIDRLKTTTLETLVIDLKATQKVFDSGLAMLLLLSKHAGHLKHPIYLTRCTSRIRSRLARSGLLSQFRVQGW